MVTTAQEPITSQSMSLADWLENPPQGTEWIQDCLIEKNDVTVKHSKAQRLLSTLWATYQEEQGVGGEVYTELPCQTKQQGRRPDVAYLTPELVAKCGQAKSIPQSPPLLAEIVSPTDVAEEIVAKVYEYLDSGAQEVWLVYPEVRWITIVTSQSKFIFSSGETARTQILLPGFSIPVDQLST